MDSRHGASTPVWATQVAGISTSDVPRLMDKLQLVEDKQDSILKCERGLPEPYPNHIVPPPPGLPVLPPPGLEPPALALQERIAAPFRKTAAPSVEKPEALSKGTVGHPKRCGNPCRYAHRKGGCTLGRDCPDCHQCNWRRGLPPKVQVPEAEEVESGPGSLSCRPCTPALADMEPAYVVLGGSFAGVPEGRTAQPSFPAEEEDNMVALDDSLMEYPCPSVGSMGHPYTCAGPCKFMRKAKGCKDGSLCTHCHLCRWQRYMAYAPQRKKKL